MHKAPAKQYDLSTHWQFEAPLDAVWAAIIDAEGWPRWWKGVESVVTLESGDARGLVHGDALPARACCPTAWSSSPA